MTKRKVSVKRKGFSRPEGRHDASQPAAKYNIGHGTFDKMQGPLETGNTSVEGRMVAYKGEKLSGTKVGSTNYKGSDALQKQFEYAFLGEADPKRS